MKTARELVKDSIVDKCAPEFQSKVSEALKNSEKIADLPACVDDIKRKLDFVVENLGVKPENVILLVTEDLFY